MTFLERTYSINFAFPAFYRQSLQIQQIHAQLFHNATVLRGINGPEDVQTMPAAQRELAIRSIHIACKGLDITVNSPSYREGMKYGMFIVKPHKQQLILVIKLSIIPTRLLPSVHRSFFDSVVFCESFGLGLSFIPLTLLPSPNDCDAVSIRSQVERLATLMAESG
jgi:hypothetical protein